MFDRTVLHMISRHISQNPFAKHPECVLMYSYVVPPADHTDVFCFVLRLAMCFYSPPYTSCFAIVNFNFGDGDIPSKASKEHQDYISATMIIVQGNKVWLTIFAHLYRKGEYMRRRTDTLTASSHVSICTYTYTQQLLLVVFVIRRVRY